MSLNFYTVTDTYIAFLKSFDNKIPNNYSGKKPYVGIILKIGDIEYLAPLTSPKPKHKHYDGNKPSIFKIEPNLGLIQINNMFPILNTQINYMDFAVQDTNYKNLLTKQRQYINSNIDEILQKSQDLYRLVTVNKNSHFCNLSCDFKLLEKNYLNFQP